MTISQKKLVKEFFENNPGRDIAHPEAVRWLMEEYRKRTGHVFADPDRAIRMLYQEGFLKKISKGIYRYDPEYVGENMIDTFSAAVKQQALERDNYKCVVCGRGRESGMELHIDHIKPMSRGGTSDLSNAQVLCSKHNFIKKNLNQTETGKKMFIHLYELAKKENNKELLNFCTEILETFEKFDINGHIVWDR